MHVHAPLFLMVLLGLAVLLVSGWRARNQGPWHKGWTAMALLHPLVTGALIGTLVYHMHQELGGWPDSIGTEGFSPDLVWHVEMAQYAFGSLLLVALFVLPSTSIVCQTIGTVRPVVRYVALYGLTAFATLAATYAAPKPFLRWWWD